MFVVGLMAGAWRSILKVHDAEACERLSLSGRTGVAQSTTCLLAESSPSWAFDPTISSYWFDRTRSIAHAREGGKTLTKQHFRDDNACGHSSVGGVPPGIAMRSRKTVRRRASSSSGDSGKLVCKPSGLPGQACSPTRRLSYPPNYPYFDQVRGATGLGWQRIENEHLEGHHAVHQTCAGQGSYYEALVASQPLEPARRRAEHRGMEVFSLPHTGNRQPCWEAIGNTSSSRRPQRDLGRHPAHVQKTRVPRTGAIRRDRCERQVMYTTRIGEASTRNY